MSEWLNLMLEEIARKKREAKEAEEESQRREKQDDGKPDGTSGLPQPAIPPAQSK